MLSYLCGDCRHILPTFPDESVHCCITSPPYWGLRDYGTGRWDGGSPGCAHDPGGRRQVPQSKAPAAAGVIVAGGNRGAGPICRRCGAVRVDGQIGREATAEEYVRTLVAVFRDVRRVLREDGTVWLNLGDSYTSGERMTRDPGRSRLHPALSKGMARASTPRRLKPKDLVGIPWRVALALQADGWYLRSDIIWHKPNCMPDSVSDRPTRSHEYLFLLTKSARYHYDADAIREAPVTTTGGACFGKQRFAAAGAGAQSRRLHAPAVRYHPKGRNKRTVWTIPTRGFHGAHFAVFPPDLIRPCLRAGCPVGGTVLDPFAGSGTTGLVAEQEGRSAVLIELNADYVALAKRRTQQAPLLAVG